ncbi:metallophosphoesterase [soil metagenome]
MVRNLLQKILTKPVNRIASKYDSRPDQERVFLSLTELRQKISNHSKEKGPVISFNSSSDRFIIFSDHHKGAKNGADDFAPAEANYIASLEYYNRQNYTYIALGDCEEFWENTIASVKDHNKPAFAREKLFLERNAFIKIFGNHDLDWDNDPFANMHLENIYGQKVPIYEGAILQTEIEGRILQIFLTHGHQGDLMSDGNMFSKWFIAKVWAPFQSYLEIRPHTPAYDADLKTEHNRLMYEWSARQNNTILITGHTHQPVFTSLTHLERLFKYLSKARESEDEEAIIKLENEINLRRRMGATIPDFTAILPGYFNSGCCCFPDGDITGIEIVEGKIILVKWKYEESQSVRILLEEIELEKCRW